MQARNRFVPILFIIAFASCGSSKKAAKPVVVNPWQVVPLVIDGNDGDWSFKNYHVHDNIPLKISFTNDKEHLYVLLKTGDQTTIMKILTAGMQCWIDVSGKKQKNAGIRFPIESTEPFQPHHQGIKNDRREDPRAQQNDVLEKLVGSAREYAVQGFKGCSGAYLLKQSNKCGIVVRVGTNDMNELVWEACIPFSSFLKDSLVKEDLGKKLLVGFEVNGMKEPEGMPGGARMGGPGGGMGMPNGSMGSPGNGGMGGGRGGGRPAMGENSGDRKQLFEATKVWQVIYLGYNG